MDGRKEHDRDRSITYPRKIISVYVEVIETEPGKHTVHHGSEENDSTMKTTGLLLYQLKKIEQELIDRVWDNGGEGFEITGEDADSF